MVIRGSGIFVPDGVVTNERHVPPDGHDRRVDPAAHGNPRTPLRAKGDVLARTSGSKPRGAPSTTRGLAASDIDLIVFATMTPAHYFPGNGGILAREARARRNPRDRHPDAVRRISLRALQVADAFIRVGHVHRRVLLVGAECHASFYPWSEADGGSCSAETDGPRLPKCVRRWDTAIRDRAVIFGDAAGAFVLEATRAATAADSSDSRCAPTATHWDKLYVPSGGSSRFPYFTPEMFADGSTIPIVEGRQVFRLATTAMPEIVREILRRARIHDR